MNNLNNKRYLGRIVLGGVLLCQCLVASAQESQTVEQRVEQTAEPRLEEVKVEPIVESIKMVPMVNEVQNQVVASKVVAGLASFYADKFHGRQTANGETFHQKLLTAAHLNLPFGTRVKVTNPANSKSVVVRVNDRGPYIRGRMIDLSRAAADLIGMTHRGVARVELEILKP